MTIILPIGAGLKFNGNKISDHNRKEIQITTNRIETRKRMADGTLRSFLIAQKDQYRVSWNSLPWKDNRTADGFWGAQSITNFYNTNSQEFTLTITYGDNTTKTVTALFANFDSKLNSRGTYTDLYDIDITMDVV